MNFRYCCFLVSWLLFNTVAAQHDSLIYQHIDRAIDTLTVATTDLKQLTDAIIAPTNDDFEKIRAIYQYVIRNIDYDAAAYREGRRRINRSNSDIITRGKAVCWGYAQLIKEMCQYAKITCVTISGYAKDVPTPARAFEKANHAWNAVQLDGTWFLLDATWGDALQYGENFFTAAYGTNYFLSSPHLFIASHFPLMPMWQLLDCPISFEEFLRGELKTDREGCAYSFADSIEVFMRLPYLEQQVKIMVEAYQINQTATNRVQVGHALIDVAFAKKERSDLLLEQDSIALAIEELEAATTFFEAAQPYCTFYPWQEEGYVFSQVNLAQAYYQGYLRDLAQQEQVKVQLTKAKNLVTSKASSLSFKQHALDLIDQYLKVLN